MSVKCDKCNNEFIITIENLHKKKVNGIEVNYFECGICKHKYITACYDDYVLREQRKLTRLEEKIVTTIDTEEKEKFTIKSQKLLKHLKIHSDRLKREIENIWIH